MDKNNALMLALAALIGLGGLATAVSAQGGRDGERPSFETLDADGDGSITGAELDARADARFAEVDTDGDGSVSLEEFTAQAAARASARAAAMFERLDADGDGALSRDVLAGRRGGADMGDRLISRADSDGDGLVSREEFDAVAERMAERRDRRGGHRWLRRN